jgi:signal peptidase I
VTQVAEPEPSTVTPKRRSRNTWIRDVIEVLLIALILYLVIANALQTVRVDGESMVGTLQNQDLLLASKVSYDFGGNPQRGDIVVLMPPNDPTRDFIKRVIAVPGDIFEIDGSKQPTQVLVKVGGQGAFQQLKEPYLPADPWTTETFCCNDKGMESGTASPVTVPAGNYFVMGDNRNRSSDSRMFGFVPRDHILAKAFLRIWPLNHFGGLGSGPSLGPVSTPALFVPAIGIAALEVWRRRQRRRRSGIEVSRSPKSRGRFPTRGDRRR